MNPIVPGTTPLSETQRLLLNLLQALQVFSAPGTTPVRLSFSKYLFTGTPAEKPLPLYQRQVQLMKTLQKAKSEVEALLDPSETKGGEAPKKSAAPSPMKKPIESAPVYKKSVEMTDHPEIKEAALLATQKNLPIRPDAATRLPGKIAPEAVPTKSEKPKEAAPQIEKGSASPVQKHPFPQGISPEISIGFPRKTPPQIAAPIKTLMDQVRSAIQLLSTSLYLEKPDKAPVADILRRIKPFLDQLITVVETQEDMHNAPDNPPREIRPLPQSSRKNLFKSELPRFIPKEKEANPAKPAPERSYRSIPTQQTPRREETADRPVERESSQRPPRKVPSPLPPPAAKSQPPFIPQQPALAPKIAPFQNIPIQQPKKGDGEEEKGPSEVREITAAPYTPEKKLEENRTKEKKKKKGFWSRSKKDEEEKHS
ncbi:MAG: hypothetical protein JSS32_05150 [Verrucomicrobia bacterium]|nr:hypothetical protein [Verrucomicrobiota bacterium]